MEVFQWALFCLIVSLRGASYAMSCDNCEIWSEWNRQCCRSNMMTRTRPCKENNCVVQEAVYCGCAVDGQWSDWNPWSTCFTICGNPSYSVSRKRRIRTCTNPTPAYGGSDCSGRSYQTHFCRNVQTCQRWPRSTWSKWTSCTVSCEGGTQTRRKECHVADDSADDSALSSNVQSTCTDIYIETQVCNNQACPVDGSWSSWSSWSDCSASCGRGTRARKRSCDNPSPSAGGLLCTNNTEEHASCNARACRPVDGSWSSWSSWSDCSASCGGGTRIRKRSCDNPPPSAGGLMCTNNTEEHATCNVRACRPEFTQTQPKGDTPAPLADSSRKENGDQLPVGAIVSIPLVVMLTLAVFVGIFCYCRRKRQQKKGNHDDQLGGGRSVTNQAYDATSAGGNIYPQNDATGYDSKDSTSKVSQQCNYNTISLTSSVSSQTPLVTNNYDVIGSVGQHAHVDYNHVRQAHVANSGLDYSHVTSILNGVTTDGTYSHICNDNVSEQMKPSVATSSMDETYNHLQNQVFTSSRSGTATKASSHENDSTYNLTNCKTANNRNLTHNAVDVEYNHANLSTRTAP